MKFANFEPPKIVIPVIIEQKTMDLRAKMVSLSMELLTSTDFSPIIKAELSDLSYWLKMEDVMSMGLELRTFEVKDTRISSRENHVKKLLCPKKGLEEAEELEVPLLRVSLLDDQVTNAYAIDVELENFTVNVLADALLATLDVVLENISAVLELVSVPEPPPAPGAPALPGGPQPPKGTAVVNAGSEHPLMAIPEDADISPSPANGEQAERPKGLRIKVALNNPGLIIVENPKAIESRSMVLRTTIVVFYTRSVEEEVEQVEKIHVNITHLESFLDKGGKVFNPIPIVEPLSLFFSMKRMFINDELKDVDVACGIDRINTRVAYNDVMLVVSILMALQEGLNR